MKLVVSGFFQNLKNLISCFFFIRGMLRAEEEEFRDRRILLELNHLSHSGFDSSFRAGFSVSASKKSQSNLLSESIKATMSKVPVQVKSPDERLFVLEAEVPTTTVGSYLAQRLVEAGTSTFFTVPGDYILGLLDSLLANKGLKMVGCCNELNGGYAGW